MRAIRRSFLPHLIAIVAMMLAFAAPALPGEASPQHHAERESVIVVLQDHVDDIRGIAHGLSARHGGTLGHVYEHALAGFSAEVPRGAIAAIQRDPRVAHVEVDQVVTTFSEVPTGVSRSEVDQKLGLSDTNPAVSYAGQLGIAILDTGIDADHPDLNVVGGVNCAKRGPFNTSCDPGGFDDGSGHGTHVAGTAAAIHRGEGVVGVAPGADLYAVKVLSDNGSGYISWIVAGIDWVTDNADKIDVANMSLGCECASAALDTALTSSTNAGVVYVVAAGNSAKDAATFSPANHPQTITVSAVADYDGKAGGQGDFTCRSDVGPDDTLATFSNFGDVVDIAAPGVCINSTIPGGGYDEFSGTSMASPHVAGAAALYLDEVGVPDGEDAWKAVRDGLTSSGWSVPASDQCGYGANSNGVAGPLLLVYTPCVIAGDGPSEPEDELTVTIDSPADGATFTEGDEVSFAASASVGDSDVTGDATWAWTSDQETEALSNEATFTTTALVVGTHLITATATHGEDEASATITIDITEATSEPTEPDQTTATVNDISYTTQGRWHLRVTVSVVDDDGNGIEGAAVSITIEDTGNQGIERSATGTTADDGTVTFQFNHALRDANCYTTTVTDVTADGVTWDSTYPVGTSNCE